MLPASTALAKITKKHASARCVVRAGKRACGRGCVFVSAVQCGSLHRIMRLGRTGGDSSSFEHVKMSIVSAFFHNHRYRSAPLRVHARMHTTKGTHARTHAPRRAEMTHCRGTESGGRATPAATERQRLCRSRGNSEVRRVRTRTSKKHTHLEVLSLVGEARLHLSARTVALHDRNLRSIDRPGRVRRSAHGQARASAAVARQTAVADGYTYRYRYIYIYIDIDIYI